MPLSTLNTTLADVVWPALYVEQRMFSWWAIGLGILIEFLFVRRLTTLNWRMCVVADVAMNAVSALLGLVLIPIGNALVQRVDRDREDPPKGICALPDRG